MDGIFGGHLVQLPSQSGHLEQVVQDHVQMAFEHLQSWTLHKLSGQPMPLLSHPHRKEELSDIQGEAPVFHFVPIASCPSTGPL